MINLFEYQNKTPFPAERLIDLEVFLDELWRKRDHSDYYSAEENLQEVQRFLQIFHKSSEIKSNKYVGVIHFEGHTVNLLPKIFHTGENVNDGEIKVINSHILWWLSYCKRLNFPSYLTALDSCAGNFMEILIYLFAKYTKELLANTIYQQYVETERELPFIKGRIDFNSYVCNKLARGAGHKIPCTYDGLEMDNPMNQCIKYVATLLMGISTDNHNRHLLSSILFILDDVSEVKITPSQCRAVKFNPAYQSFEIVRDYCVLFLENSLSFHFKNKLKLFAFLLPMEYVFENFISGFIKHEVSGVTVNSKVKGTYLDESKIFGLNPDMVLQAGSTKIIADAKYKLIYTDEQDKKKGISQSDLYQMLAYAVRFNIPNIKLFYPKNINDLKKDEVISMEILNKLGEDRSIHIEAYQLSIINKDLKVEQMGNRSIKELFSSTEDILREQLHRILTCP